MRKQQLIKFIEGKTSISEQKKVLSWIQKNDANNKYFLGLKNLWVISSLPYEESHRDEFAHFRRDNFNVDKNTKGKNFSFLTIAASLLLLVTIGLNIFQYDRSNLNTQKLEDNSSMLSLKDRKVNTLSFYTNKGVKGVVTLPDSSVVWLNSDTRLTYPERFTGKFREVEISGEAYFEVRSNPDTAMIVSTNKGLKIEVLGTKFLIRSYADDNDAQATLFSGSIKLISSSTRFSKGYIKKLKPLESVIIDKDHSIRVIHHADTLKSIAWKSGLLIFEETPIQQVLKELERWHGTEFIIQDKSILSCNITAQFNSESIVQIMEVIKFCSPIDYSIKGRQIYLSAR